MYPYQQQFLELAVRRQVLRFGEFTLKSGRISPYFFNAGLFDDGDSLNQVSEAYASRILDCGTDFDMLFGPAYKGLPLATGAAIALARRGRNVPVAFNRKEAKSHGEGGNLIGAPLKGRVLIIDDVITAGTAIRESIDIIHAQGAQVAGIVIALDRQEKGKDTALSASQEIQQRFGFPVFSIVGLGELLGFVEHQPELAQYRQALQNYRNHYGV
ncbi:orotate phosphoribosyltransferase [Arenimonas sp.]|jgi:orotate phosphoribosyltransferase|uniref:orotate phosphoribosyltransferase n=1 Tax=Arenimonas sp. TaxID=1872635 RepID=UPI0037BEBA30